LIPASGSTSVVEVPLLFVVRYIYGTTTYGPTANTSCQFYYTGPAATNKIAVKGKMLEFTTSGIDVIYPDNYNAIGNPEILLTPNYPLVITTSIGNPTTGDGSVVIYTISTTVNI
jgi:hypothetical protein